MTVKENEKDLDLLNCEISQGFDKISLVFVRDHVTAQKTSDVETVDLLLTQLFLYDFRDIVYLLWPLLAFLILQLREQEEVTSQVPPSQHQGMQIQNGFITNWCAYLGRAGKE